MGESTQTSSPRITKESTKQQTSSTSVKVLYYRYNRKSHNCLPPRRKTFPPVIQRQSSISKTEKKKKAKMPKLIFHDLKSTQKKVSVYSKGLKSADDNQRPKPNTPQVKTLKYINLVVIWRKKTKESKELTAKTCWQQMPPSEL